ncbi:MAG: glutamate--tRNA ligase [Firmicutes bacterium]|nr:glutamate--tRNA ligase [Bacillota bacterium]
MADNSDMADLLFKDITLTPEDYEERYPKRNVKDGAVVTRFAPSPTGFLHFGGLFAGFIGKTAAAASDGIFYLRIEDTDKKREVENGAELIIEGLKEYGIEFDEGVVSSTEDKGDYAPYTQSKRTEIYQAYVKRLVEEGRAYPCFMTEEEIAEVRKKQEEEKLLPGIYGKYAKYSGITADEAKRLIGEGKEYVIRLKSPGVPGGRIKFKDLIKGEIEMDENILDVVLLKKDGTPTYHFAHAVDDHLMRTTHVIRGDEWLSSVPIHLQLFRVCGFKPVKYAHISPIMKTENGGKRKLSKRKDPEMAMSFYNEAGYPVGAVWEYLMTLANSNYEEWRACNKTAPITDFKFTFAKMNKAGALFDMVKLNDISKNYISLLSAEEVFDLAAQWAKTYDEELYSLLAQDEEYAISIFAIDRGGKKPRKDIAKWSDVKDYIEYFYTELWDGKRDFAQTLSNADKTQILEAYKKVYSEDTTAEEWFPQIKEMAVELGYASSPKEYKASPDSFKGHTGDVAGVIRAAITGRQNTPDLYEIMQVLGAEETIKRIDEAIKILK